MRYLVSHARNSGGNLNFIIYDIMITKSNGEHGDYHKDNDGKELNKWVIDKVVPSFTQKSCLVMDNAFHVT